MHQAANFSSKYDLHSNLLRFIWPFTTELLQEVLYIVLYLYLVLIDKADFNFDVVNSNFNLPDGDCKYIGMSQ